MAKLDPVTRYASDVVRGRIVACRLVTLACQLEGEAMARIFTQDDRVVGVTITFLTIISWNFIAMGIVFTCSSIFQGLGNTWPSLISMGLRVVAFVVLAVWASRLAGFQLRHLWYLSVGTASVQALFSLWLVRGQLRARLGGFA